ncbi:MAG TPA: helix-turn-helix transcriptional regulator [Solirubrobacterales bacterium]|nr:helix-turn-helix transcriptional regulator [Solirubrobacterales bacterium]
MGRISQGSASEPHLDEAKAVLVDRRGSAGRVAELLRSRGVEFDLVEDRAELLAGEAPAQLVLLRTSTNLGQAASREVEPLCRAVPGVPVVVICTEVRPGELRGALAAGAAGVVVEDQLEVALGPCLTAVRAGQVCVPKQHARQVEPAALSAREKQILGLVVMGYMNSEIAGQLFVAESTVKSHLSSAFGKLGVRSRNEAVDLILDPERGLGMGILELGGERIKAGSGAR